MANYKIRRRPIDSTKCAEIGGDREQYDGVLIKPETIPNQNKAIVALKGDGLFWYYRDTILVAEAITLLICPSGM